MRVPAVQQPLFAITISDDGQLGLQIDKDNIEEYFSPIPEQERPQTPAEQSIALLVPILADLIATRNNEHNRSHADGLAEELYQLAAVFANCLVRSGEVCTGTEEFARLTRIVNKAAELSCIY